MEISHGRGREILTLVEANTSELNWDCFSGKRVWHLLFAQHVLCL